MIHPVILCGGAGTRLWPSSRKAFPKQFGRLIGQDTLFQMTLKRFTGLEFAAPLIMTNADFRFVVTEQCEEIGMMDARIVIEPAARNTAPAILCAALLLEDQPDALMLVSPSDHIISGVDSLHAAVQAGARAAGQGNLVSFGIPPDRAETAYGYLELAQRAEINSPAAVSRFTEKPDAQTARAMLEDGHHLWNAGLFLWRVRDIIAAFARFAPDMVPPCREAVATHHQDLGFTRLGQAAFDAVRAQSIDYAVMEQAENVVAVPLDCHWSDLGSWDALWSASEQDATGVVRQGSSTALECENTLLRSEEESMHLVGVGLKNIVAVAMRDAVLVADMGASQQIKEAVTLLREAQVEQGSDYPRFYRPWGWYETLCLGNRFRVKRIMIKPGGTLSLQSHVHRAEHWVVVAGTAQVNIAETEQLLTQNQSIYVPLGVVHRISNPGRLAMHLIEVQTGSYLGEDDIVRYEDVYNRD